MTVRFRDRYQQYPDAELSIDRIIGSGSEGVLYTYPCSLSEEMTDVVTPDFHNRIAKGEIINNPCSYTKVETTNSNDAVAHYKNGSSWEYWLYGALTDLREGAFPAMSEIDAEPSDVEARCKLLALANLDSTPYAFGEDTLEIKETIKFLKNPLGSLLNLSRSFRDAYKKRISEMRDLNKIIKAHEDVWLSYRFAFSPLVRSCTDALEAFQSQPKSKPERLSSRGKDSFDHYGTNLVTQSYYTFKHELNRTVEGKASILYEVTNPIYDWKYTLGFRAKDWPTTIWQVMPYSFMVDRLYDVTSFSKGAINLADPRVKILSACYSSKSEVIRKSRILSDHPTYCLSIKGNTREQKEFAYNRVPWTPSFYDTIPRFTPKELVKDLTNILDLTSLIHQNIRI